jgi:leucyl/phenylalanyl-tRNA--protein transferase
VRQLKEENVFLVDCQVYTLHLESLGAEMMERVDFMRALKTYG